MFEFSATQNDFNLKVTTQRTHSMSPRKPRDPRFYLVQPDETVFADNVQRIYE